MFSFFLEFWTLQTNIDNYLEIQKSTCSEILIRWNKYQENAFAPHYFGAQNW